MYKIYVKHSSKYKTNYCFEVKKIILRHLKQKFKTTSATEHYFL